jgi:hypothetical protein
VKRYVLLLAYVPGRWEQADETERQSYFDAHHAFEAYVTEHGKHLGGAALADTDVATTVRHDGDRAVVTDGPWVETAEVVGGYYDVELPDLDSAIAAASLLPPSYAVEIRPTVSIEGYEGV